MIGVFNHRAQDLPEALFIDAEVTEQVYDMCIQYHGTVSITHILEIVQDTFGLESMVLASFVLGRLQAIKDNNLFNLNLISCQREN